MTIYGLNFNGSHIPGAVKAKFAKERKVDGKWFYLQGVCQTEEEKEAMLMAASNGKRIFHIEVRQAWTGNWMGVYVA